MGFYDQTIGDVWIPIPCKKCTKETGRYPGCHSKCERYLDFREKLDTKKKEARQHQFEKSGIYISYKNKYNRKNNKHSEV